VAATADEAAAAAVETRSGGGGWNEIGDLQNRPRASGSGGSLDSREYLISLNAGTI
jgi:hypothetical protein